MRFLGGDRRRVGSPPIEILAIHSPIWEDVQTAGRPNTPRSKRPETFLAQVAASARYADRADAPMLRNNKNLKDLLHVARSYVKKGRSPGKKFSQRESMERVLAEIAEDDPKARRQAAEFLEARLSGPRRRGGSVGTGVKTLVEKVIEQEEAEARRCAHVPLAPAILSPVFAAARAFKSPGRIRPQTNSAEGNSPARSAGRPRLEQGATQPAFEAQATQEEVNVFKNAMDVARSVGVLEKPRDNGMYRGD